MQAFLKIESLSKAYIPAKPVFADVSFTIDKSDVAIERWTKPDARSEQARANFARVFRQVAGTTPAALLQQLRMAQAAQWLREDKRPVADIGEQAGYQSEAAFNRVFKRHFGMGPGQYRRTATIKDGAPPAPAG